MAGATGGAMGDAVPQPRGDARTEPTNTPWGGAPSGPSDDARSRTAGASTGDPTDAGTDIGADMHRATAKSPGGPQGAAPVESPVEPSGEPMGDAMWQSSPPGSIYDYIKVASFSIGADGLVDQWSLRAGPA
jgi:hypothetical protein